MTKYRWMAPPTEPGGASTRAAVFKNEPAWVNEIRDVLLRKGPDKFNPIRDCGDFNPLLMVDSYKDSHPPQMPPGTTRIFSYAESRGGEFPHTVFFGLQYFLLRYMMRQITDQDVTEAAEFARLHGEPFFTENWLHIVNDHDGKWPVRIRAVPEGTVVPYSNVLLTIENTCDKCYWVTNFLETGLMRAVWYGTTVATLSYHCRKIIHRYLEQTCDNPEAEIMFKLHDFGARGVSSHESAAIGGAAHLVNFMGSDTKEGIDLANRFYSCKMAGFSIPAAEHSTITAWGRVNEVKAYANMIDQFCMAYGKAGRFPLIAVVSDSYNIYHAVKHIWGRVLKQKVLECGSTIVIRPDSGIPHEVVPKVLKLLKASFGAKKNNKGYWVLNKAVRVIQGDGITIKSLPKILFAVKKAGFSTENVGFGMGGGLLQQVNRDVQKMAMKCSWARIGREPVDVFKQPVGDLSKWSKRGRLTLIKRHGYDFETVRMVGSGTFDSQYNEEYVDNCVLQLVYDENGFRNAIFQRLDDIRRRAWPEKVV